MQALLLQNQMPDVLSPPTRITLQTLLAPGVAAVRRYWRPFVLLQSAAFLLVLGYYTNDNIRRICTELSDFKQRGGVVFAGISAGLAGAILPELAKAIMLEDRVVDRKRLANLTFAMVGFAINGIMVDLQYRGLAWIFGNDAHALTIIKKVLVDQFICTAGYSTPFWVLFYGLRASRYDLLKTARQISPHWYLSRVLPLLIPTWCFWIPMVALIYSLPEPLQFCLFCFALAAWSLVLVFVATHEAAKIEDGG